MNNKNISISVFFPYLIKFAAIIEKEGYYRTWVNEIIAPKVNCET